MTRDMLEAWLEETWGVEGDFPFEEDFVTKVYRHRDNRKWFALLMRIPASRLGLPSEALLDVVNLKCSEDVRDSLWGTEGIHPAYHMSKRHWISVRLDGSVDRQTVEFLLGVSYSLTKQKEKKRRNPLSAL